MAKVYDHRNKTGNQGDVVKHVALIAALDVILDAHEKAEFVYADTYAGYAHNPLQKGNEWENGIGMIREAQNSFDALNANKHTALWRKWYLEGRPTFLNGMYPGSSLIALDLCRNSGKMPRLALWDISPTVISNLMIVYGQEHSIHARPAEPGEPDVLNADFLLIDPPVVEWDKILTFLNSLDKQQPFLVWLAVGAHQDEHGNIVEKKISDTCKEGALSNGFNYTKVIWGKEIGTIGCQLIFRLDDIAKSAMLNALECIRGITGWIVNNYDPNIAVDEKGRINER